MRSKDTNQYGLDGVCISESGAMDGGGKVGCASNGDNKYSARTRG
jgi:hypothetical protein